MGKYDDIINLPHHVSKKYPKMSLEQRAVQFAPFASLVGYSDSVKETARLTNRRIELDEEIKKMLDLKLQEIQNHKNEVITFTYFIPDLKKDGGKYVNISGIIKKIDDYKQEIILDDNTKIPIKEIIDIQIQNL